MKPSALLLAAGKATRLGVLRERYAKACVPIAGTTPLASMIEQLIAAGIERVCINLHWQGQQVREVACRANRDRAELIWLEEDELLGTGGSLLAAVDLLGDLPDWVINAKQFGDIDWQALQHAPRGTLLVHPASSLAVFGGLSYDPRTGLLSGLVPRGEAPSLPAGDVAAVYTGIARPAATWLEELQRTANAAPLCLARHGFLASAAAGEAVRIVEHHGWWCEISTPERVAIAEQLLLQHAAD